MLALAAYYLPLPLLQTIISGIFSLFAGIVSVLIAVAGYLFKNWKSEVAKYYTVLFSYEWQIKNNRYLIQQLLSATGDEEKILTALVHLDAYKESYMEVFDNAVRQSLQIYEHSLLQLKTTKRITPNDLNDSIQKADQALSVIQGQIKLFQESVGNNPLTFYALPHIIRLILNRFLKYRP